MSFRESLKNGQSAEICVGNLYKECGLTIEYNKDARFDIVAYNLEGLCFTTEVKFDMYEAKSGNVAIEVYTTKTHRLSGLTNTTSTLWAHVLLNKEVHLISTNYLRQLVEEIKVEKIVEKGGDNNASLFLFKSSILLPYFSRIDDIGPAKRLKLIRRLIHAD